MKKILILFILIQTVVSGSVETAMNNFNKGNWVYALFELKPEFHKETKPAKKAWIAHYIATAYYNRAMHEQAIEWYKISYNWYKTAQDSRNANYELNNIGTIYLAIKQYKVAKLYFNQSNEVDPELVEWTKLNLGSVYYGLNQLDSANLMWRSVKDSSLYGIVAGNLAMMYNKLGQTDSALKWYSIHINSNMNDSYNIADSYLNMVKLSYKKWPKIAKKWLDKADSISDQTKDIELQIQLAETKSIINPDSSYYWHEIMYQLKDSLYDQKTEARLADQMQEFDLKYQLSDKNLKLSIVSNEKKWANRGLYLLITIVFLLLIVTIIIIRQKSKIAKEKERSVNLSTKLKIKNDEICDSIRYTKALQDGILSSSNWIENDDLISFFYKPKDTVSGDFYWAKEFDRIKYIAVCDCTGHGIPGAIMSSICYNAMNQVFTKSSLNIELDKLCTELNSIVWNAFTSEVRQKMKDGMDMSIVRINNGLVEWVGCNNQSLYISKEQRLDQMLYQSGSDKGHIYKIQPSKSGIGSTETAEYQSKKIQIAEGDRILLFTDGLIDQFGGKDGKKWKLKQVVNSIQKSSDDVVGSVLTDLNDWQANHEQTDDITFLEIKL